MLLCVVLHHEIVGFECLYMCLPKTKDTALATHQGLSGAGCTCTPLAENPRAQDQLPPGTRAEHLIWDVASPTNFYIDRNSLVRGTDNKAINLVLQRELHA